MRGGYVGADGSEHRCKERGPSRRPRSPLSLLVVDHRHAHNDHQPVYRERQDVRNLGRLANLSAISVVCDDQ
jgi:hypothetical protein